MNTQVVAFVLLLLLVVPSIVKTEMCTCPADNYYLTFTESSCLREALRAELTSTSANIQKLQNLYFLNNVQQDHVLGTTLTVSVSPSSEFLPVHTDSIPENNTQFVWTHRWYEDNFVSVTRELIKASFFTDPITTYLQTARNVLPFDSQVQQTFYIHLNCVSRGESLPMLEQRMREIWEGILLWVSSEA